MYTFTYIYIYIFCGVAITCTFVQWPRFCIPHHVGHSFMGHSWTRGIISSCPRQGVRENRFWLTENPQSVGFPMVFPWFSHGFPLNLWVFPWFSHGFPMNLRVFPMAFQPRPVRQTDLLGLGEMCRRQCADPQRLWSWTLQIAMKSMVSIWYEHMVDIWLVYG